MRDLYIILGYGVPKDIVKDGGYRRYLTAVLEAINRAKKKTNAQKTCIIFSGGLTDCRKPFRRTEAREMIKLFRFIANRSSARGSARKWQLIPEARALSTVENLVFTKTLLKKRGIEAGHINIFCEYTRRRRVGILARKMFGPQYKIAIRAIDFDTGPNRFAEPKFLRDKERAQLLEARKALQSSASAKQHHKLMQDKIRFLRNAKNMSHSEAVARWWASRMQHAAPH
ncbi:MAG: ElyC/SanA/YdcF family protein [Patescibacteria group bacterium]